MIQSSLYSWILYQPLSAFVNEKIHLVYSVKFRFQEQIFLPIISITFSYLSDFSTRNFECQPNQILNMLLNFLVGRK